MTDSIENFKKKMYVKNVVKDTVVWFRNLFSQSVFMLTFVFSIHITTPWSMIIILHASFML